VDWLCAVSLQEGRTKVWEWYAHGMQMSVVVAMRFCNVLVQAC
jgi:hypothetical protein